LHRLEREAAKEPSEHQRITFHGDLAAWNARLKGPAAAPAVREQVVAGRACAEVAGCPRCEAELLLLSAEALARTGERTEARGMLACWDDGSAHRDELDALLRLHAGALAEEDAAARAEALEASLSTAEESPYRLESLWIRLDLGVALAEMGSDRAVAELDRAAVIARQLGAGTVQELAEKALRSLGVRTWRRGRVEGALTRREQEVARLVVDGATNNEIAKLLFLSAKTVERHVSNVLRKVGARNRTELASRLRDREAKHAGNPR
jgi:DNA-binding CsgD family transcriptional regulator